MTHTMTSLHTKELGQYNSVFEVGCQPGSEVRAVLLGEGRPELSHALGL